MHYLGLPFLAGLAELERTTPGDPAGWDEDRIRRALTFYYCELHGTYEPSWYQRLLKTRPEAVAHLQVRFAISELRSGLDHIDKLWELAHNPAHAQVAQHAALPLLEAFPNRCNLNQTWLLDCLLSGQPSNTPTRTQLKDTIEKKLVPAGHECRPARPLAVRGRHRLTRSPSRGSRGLRPGRAQTAAGPAAGRVIPPRRPNCRASSEKLGSSSSRPPSRSSLIHLVGGITRSDEWQDGHVALHDASLRVSSARSSNNLRTHPPVRQATRSTASSADPALRPLVRSCSPRRATANK